jgi:tetratricopeptide (TPR) repeat protein
MKLFSPNQTTAWAAAQLAVLGRQLLLVPEAVVLLALMCLHSALGAPPLLSLLGLLTTAFFVTRAGLLALGHRTLVTARYDDATRFAQAALSLYPGSADAHALMATLLLARGDSDEAALAFRRAIALFPLQANLHSALSAALLEAGRPVEACEEARRAVELDPTLAAAYLHLANAEERLGATPEAVEGLLRVGLQHPASPADEATLRCSLAALLIAAGRAAEAQLALANVERLLAACPAPQRAGLHFYIGEMLRMGGNTEAARNHFSASETLDPHGRHAAAAWRAARL